MMMKQKFVLYLIFSAITTVQILAQVNVTFYNENGDVFFDVDSDKKGSQTLVLRFSELYGYQESHRSEVIIPINSGLNRAVYKLTKRREEPSSFRYSYTCRRGKYNAKPDKDYPYILPAKAGTLLSISKFENMKYRLGKSDIDSIIGIAFNYKGLDTICAMRSGEVIEIKHNEEDSKNPKADIVYDKSSRNIVMVEHADGSIVRYVCITPVNVLIEEGERIIAGQPIAVFKEDVNRQRMGIHLFHLTREVKNEIIIPKFFTEEGITLLNSGKQYQSISTNELLEKELTKKEKKKIQKAK